LRARKHMCLYYYGYNCGCALVNILTRIQLASSPIKRTHIHNTRLKDQAKRVYYLYYTAATNCVVFRHYIQMHLRLVLNTKVSPIFDDEYNTSLLSLKLTTAAAVWIWYQNIIIQLLCNTIYLLSLCIYKLERESLGGFLPSIFRHKHEFHFD